MLNNGKYVILFNYFGLDGKLTGQKKMGEFSISGNGVVSSEGICSSSVPIGPLTQSIELRITHGFNTGYFEVRHEQSFRPRPLTKSSSKESTIDGKGPYVKMLKALDQFLGQGMMNVKLDRRFLVPGLAGSSLDGKTVYIDSRLPEVFKGVQTDKYLLVHEVTEKTVMDKLGFDYSYAHSIATAAERWAVEQDSLNWDEYQKHMLDFIHAYSRAQSIPKDKRPPDLDPDRITHDRSVKDIMRHDLHKSVDKPKAKRFATIAVIHPETKNILMGKRNDNSAYTMPGGHINDNETPLDGAKRELLEETGIAAKSLVYLGSNTVKSPRGVDMLIYSFSYKKPVKETDTEQDPDNEVQEWEWISPQKMKEITHHVPLEKNTTLKLLKRGDALKKADKINVDDEKTNRYEKQKERVFNRDISLTPQELTDFLEDAETRQDFNSMGVVFNHPNHTSEHLDTVLNDPRFLATEDVKPEEKYLYRASNKKETVFPAFRTGRFGSSFLRSGKFSDQQIEDLTERMHNNQDHSHTYAIMNYLPENDNLSPHATEKLFDIMSQNSMVKYSDAGRTVFSALGKKLARMPNLSEDTMKKLATHQNPDVRRVLAGNPDATPELIKHLSNDNNKYVAAAARDKQTYHGVAENPQSVVISHGSNKARQVRDWIGAHGGEMHHKELKAAGLDLDSMKMSHLKDGKGYVKADSVQKHIDSLPTSEYHYSIGKYGYDPSENYGAEGHPQRDQYRDLEGDDYDSLPSQEQRHSSETSKVFQLNVTPDHVHKMKQAGVLDTFLKMNNSSVESNHPVSPTHGIGWVRYTQNQDGTFIDEIQSDISNSLVKKARSQAQKMDMGDDYVNHMAAKAEAIYPDTHHKKINEILFGGKDASEVLHEGFNQYLRDTGHVGKPIHTWNANSKAAISLGTEDETEAIPAHMQRTYDQVPKKMGYTPAQYGELSTQSDSELKHLRTQKTVLRKSDEEEYEEFIKSIESERCKIF